MTVKTSFDDWLCWLLSSPLMTIITSMYTMGTQLERNDQQQFKLAAT